jgi:hypothetical protein
LKGVPLLFMMASRMGCIPCWIGKAKAFVRCRAPYFWRHFVRAAFFKSNLYLVRITKYLTAVWSAVWGFASAS